MTALLRLSAAAAPFAHLLGLRTRAERMEARHSRHAKDEDDTKDEADEKEEASTAEEDDEEKDKATAADGDDADDDQGDDRADDDGDDDKDKGSRKGRKGKHSRRAKDDDAGVDGRAQDDDEDMRGHGVCAQARRRERARCKTIFACKAAGVRPDVAASIAFDTLLTRDEAVALLTATSAGQPPARTRLDERMAAVPVTNVGPESGNAPPSHLTPAAAAIIAVAERLRPH